MDTASLLSAPVAVEAWTLSYLEKRVARMVKSAARLKQAAPALVVGERFEKRVLSHSNDFGEPVYTSRSYVNVQVQGERPVLKGWKTIANLVKVGDFNVIRSSSDLGLEAYAERVNVCDHCGTKRKRNETWIFQNEETGELKQVARSCVKDFVGMSDVDLKNLERWANLTGEVGSSEFTTGAWAAANYVDVFDLLAAAHAAVEAYGWLSKSKAMDSGRNSTIGDAMNILRCYQNPALRAEGDTTPYITADNFKYAAEALEWIRAQLTTAQGDYILNASRACQEDVVSIKLAALIASVAGAAYPRHCRTREEKKAEAAKAANEPQKISEYVGEIKKRQVFKGLTVSRINVRETDFGDCTNLTFEDPTGNTLLWKASGDVSEAWEIGQAVDLKATVKSHWTGSRGGKITSINRGVVVPAQT